MATKGKHAPYMYDQNDNGLQPNLQFKLKNSNLKLELQPNLHSELKKNNINRNFELQSNLHFQVKK